jgi:hypothetical protein
VTSFADEKRTLLVQVDGCTIAHLTRCKQLIVLVGQPQAINIAARNDKTGLRYTNLARACARR